MAEPEYDAFLSYSHTDHRLAPAVQRGLHRLARRWYRPRALRVFRDQESLSANPSLWTAISAALSRSRYFILMASPEAAESEWVGQEVGYWRENREPDKFLIVLAKGTITWRGDDFDWDRTDALPPGLASWFTSEPLWVDLSWARDDEELSLRHSRFRSELASIAAPLHGIAKDELDSEDVRQHRRNVRVRRTGVSLLTVLAVVVLVLSLVTLWQRGQVEDQRDRALSRELAGRSEQMGDSDPALAKLLSVAAWRVSPTPEARAGMLLAAARPGIGILETASNAVAFSPDGKTLATGREDIRLWDVATRREVRRFSGHTEPVQSLVFSPDGKTLASGGDDSTARLWDVATGNQIGEPIACYDEEFPTMLRFDPPISLSPDGTTLAMGCGDGPIRLWDVASQQQVGMLVGHEAPQLPLVGPSVAFSPTGATLASASLDGTMRFWDATARRQTAALEGLPGQAVGFEGPSVAFSPDGEVVATAATDGTVQVWDAVERQRVGALVAGRTQPNDDQATPTAAFAPVGTTLATGAHDGTIRLWDVTRRQQIGTALTGHTRAVLAVAFSPDRRTLASAGLDGTVRLWDVGAHLQVSAPLTGDTGPLHSVAFSPDGKTVAVGSYGDWAAEDPNGPGACSGGGWTTCTGGNINHPNTRPTTSLWDVDKRTLVAGHQASHFGIVNSVAVSPDGRVVATGSGDTSVRLWDVQARRQVNLPPMGHHLPVRSVAFSPDGRTVASGGVDNALRLWDVSYTVDVVTTLCDTAKRSLTPEEWMRHVPDVQYRQICPPSA